MRRSERRWHWEVLSFLLVIFCAAIDNLIGPELSVFYLIPIYIATMRVNRRLGWFISVLSATTWFVDYYRFGTTVIPFWETMVRLGFFFFATFILGRLKEALIEEKRLARIDDTTGIDNRKCFFEFARREFEKSQRYCHPFTIVYMDVDDFKKVNDTYGHQTGDRLLRTIGRAMKATLRSYDLVARLGGDEFILMFPETGPDSAHETVSRIQNHLQTTINDHGYAVTFSFGVAVFTAAPASLNDAVDLADTLMYSVKKSGKGAAAFEIYPAIPKEATSAQ